MKTTTTGLNFGIIASSLVLLLSGGCTVGGSTGHDDDGGTSDGDGGGTKHDGSTPRLGWGYITLASYSFVSGVTNVKVSTAAVGFGGLTMAVPCTTSAVGAACQLSVCQSAIATSDGGTVTYPDAGKINITGGTRAVALSPQPDGSYGAAVDTMNTLWNGGELLSVAGLGNKVPAFSTTISAPNAAKLTMPTDPALGSKLMVNRNTDLTLKWTGGQGGSVQATLTAFATNVSTSVVCTFAASDNMGVIPAAAIMKIPATTMGGFTFNTENTKMLQAGGYDLTVTAQSLATGSSGSVTSYGAVYQ